MDINDIYRPVNPEPPVKEKKVGVRSGGRMAASIIISIFLFVGLLGMMLLVLARQVGTKTTIKKVIKEVNIATLDVSEFVDDVEEGTNLTDLIYDEISEFDEFKDVSKEDIEQFIDEDVSDYFAGILEEYVDVIYTGEGKPQIDVDEIVEIIENSDNEYLKDIEITEEDKELIKDTLEEYNIETIVTEIIIEEDDPVFKAIRRVTAPSTLAIAGGVVFLLVVLLVVINLKYITSWMLHISIPMIITGVVLIIAGVVIKVLDIKGIVDGGAMVDSIVEAVQKALSGKVFVIAGILAVVGVIVTTASGIMAHINKKKAVTE